MAEKDITQDGNLTNNTTPALTDRIPYIDDGSTSLQDIKLGYLFKALYMEDGVLINGKISVTVSSNNLTVAIKTYAGSDPSSNDPVFVKINGTVRELTSALSVTLNAGTNWFNSGATAHATFENNYFVYLGWRAASSALVLGFARIPYATLYSDFSSTTTNEKHGAFSTAPGAADDVVNIGRFTATLSATASFNWSVPTFTSSNLIQRPIYETEWLNWQPSPTGYSSVPTNTVYQYKITGKNLALEIREATTGTSNATTLTLTAPFTAVTLSNGIWQCFITATDNGSTLTAAGRLTILSNTSTITAYSSASTGAWTNANGKCINKSTQLVYPIA